MDHLIFIEGLDALTLWGEFTNSKLFLPDLNIYVVLRPFAVGALKGNLFQHGTNPFNGLNRYCGAWFVDQRALDRFQISLPLPVPLHDPYVHGQKPRSYRPSPIISVEPVAAPLPSNLPPEFLGKHK